MDKERIEEVKEELARIESLEDYDTEEYDDFLDDVSDTQQLVNTYTASRILKEVDPICYNMGKTEFWDNRVYELEEELKELEGVVEDD